MTTQDTNEAAIWICLQQIPGLNSQGICKLLSQFGSPESIFAAPHQALKQVVSDAISNLIKQGPDLEAIEPSLQWLQKDGNEEQRWLCRVLLHRPGRQRESTPVGCQDSRQVRIILQRREHLLCRCRGHHHRNQPQRLRRPEAC